MCIDLCLKGGGGCLGVLPMKFFKQYSYKMVPFLCNYDGYTCQDTGIMKQQEGVFKCSDNSTQSEMCRCTRICVI